MSRDESTMAIRSKSHPGHPWRDESVMRELYIERELSINQIADELPCGATCVRNWLNNHDIPIRSISQAKIIREGNKYNAPLRMNAEGYEVFWTSQQDGNKCVWHHRLMMVAEHGFDALYGMDVHHKNEIQWDNRPENLELVPTGKHRGQHSKKITGIDRLRVAEMYEHGDISSRDLADLFDVTGGTVLAIHEEGYGDA